MITTVLFDLDGTLLPMDQDTFVQAYFSALARRLAPLGYDPKALVSAIRKGTAAMVANDGSGTNEEVFWNTFCSLMGEEARKDMPEFDAFYRSDFEAVKEVCGYSSKARAIVKFCQSQGMRTVLATNPLFPEVATRARMRWAGLHASDFVHVTTYENAHFCKPNPDYYREIVDKLRLDPRRCLMVGNDAREDTVAETLGMKVFLVTDCLIADPDTDLSRWPHGSIEDLADYLRD